MMTTNHITRRRFLGWLTIVSIPITGFLNRVSPSIVLQPHEIGRHLVNASFYRSEDATQLGKSYMCQFPNDYNLASLIDTLSSRNASLLEVAASNESNNSSLILQQMIIQDFESGNVVIVDGWVVAQTEAQLSAIASLV